MFLFTAQRHKLFICAFSSVSFCGLDGMLAPTHLDLWQSYFLPFETLLLLSLLALIILVCFLSALAPLISHTVTGTYPHCVYVLFRRFLLRGLRLPALRPRNLTSMTTISLL
jgi:hypothetical protein